MELLPRGARVARLLPALTALLGREVDDVMSVAERRGSLSLPVGRDMREVAIAAMEAEDFVEHAPVRTFERFKNAMHLPKPQTLNPKP